MIRNIFIFLFFGFVLCFIAIWFINGGLTRTTAIVKSSPDPLAYLLGLSSSSDAFFTLPGQASIMPAAPTADTGTPSNTSGSLSPADAQARLTALQNQYQDLRSQYDTSGAGYTHPQ